MFVRDESMKNVTLLFPDAIPIALLPYVRDPLIFIGMAALPPIAAIHTSGTDTSSFGGRAVVSQAKHRNTGKQFIL